MRRGPWWKGARLGAVLCMAGCGRIAEEPPANGPTGDSAVAEPDGLPQGLCNPEGWCWVEPRPFGEVLSALHGTPDGDHLFATTTSGAVLEYDRGTWSYHDLRLMQALRVHLLAADDVWVAGAGLWHYDGASWTESVSAHIRDLTRTEDGTLWTTANGRLLRREGVDWVDVSPSDDFAYSLLLPGSAPSELWVLAIEPPVARSSYAVLHHFDGATWTLSRPEPALDWVDGAFFRWGEDVYVADRRELRRASSGWELVTSLPVPLRAWSRPDGVAYLATEEGLLRLDEAGSTPVSSHAPLALWSTEANDLWLGESRGGVTHLDARGQELPITATPLPPPVSWADQTWGSVPAELWAGASAWGSGPEDVFRVAGSDGAERFDGRAWSPVTDTWTAAVDGSGPDNVWLVPADLAFLVDEEVHSSLLRWDGERMVGHPLPQADHAPLAVRTFGPDDTWVIAGPLLGDERELLHFDGVSWSSRPLQGFLSSAALAGQSSEELWVLTSAGLHLFDGEALGLVIDTGPTQGVTLTDLAVDDRDVWVMGTQDAYVRTPEGFRTEPIGRGALARIELTERYLWTFQAHGDDYRVARRSR